MNQSNYVSSAKRILKPLGHNCFVIEEYFLFINNLCQSIISAKLYRHFLANYSSAYYKRDFRLQELMLQIYHQTIFLILLLNRKRLVFICESVCLLIFALIPTHFFPLRRHFISSFITSYFSTDFSLGKKNIILESDLIRGSRRILANIILRRNFRRT